MEKWKCFLCFSEFIELERVIEHLKKEHGLIQKVNEIKCIANNATCKKTFQTWSGFKKHIQTCRKSRNIQDYINNDNSSVVNTFLYGEVDVQNVTVPSGKIPIIIHSDHSGDKTEHTSDDTTDDEDDETSDLYGRMMTSVQHCAEKIEILGVTEIVKNSIYSLIEDLLTQNYTFNYHSMKKNIKPDNYVFEVLEIAHDEVLNEVRKYNTAHKRNKIIEVNELFVKPENRAIGTHWETKRNFKSEIINPLHKQSSFQYVPITKTLKSLFLRPDFQQLYFDYNDVSIGSKHKCAEGLYKDFCCGHVHKNNNLFRDHPEAIQIQLFTDGFEVCDPLKTKANLHSQVSFYFAIRNLPPEHAFNLKNLHLVALANADYLKSDQTDYNNIWEIIVDDLAILENTGIEIIDGYKLKGKFIVCQLHFQFPHEINCNNFFQELSSTLHLTTLVETFPWAFLAVVLRFSAEFAKYPEKKAKQLYRTIRINIEQKINMRSLLTKSKHRSKLIVKKQKASLDIVNLTI